MVYMEAIEKRHTVRQYQNKELPLAVIEQLNKRITKLNREYGINISLMTNNTEAFGPIMKLIRTKGVRNYLVLAGKDEAVIDEKLGYCGTDLMLLAQTLGLNSWWVGGTFKREKVAKIVGIKADEHIIGIIALGYGTNQGKAHKSKDIGEVAAYRGEMPTWFIKGVKAALLAPTALNHQAFKIVGEKNKVSITCDNGVYTNVDLGIVKYHFEVGAGKESFEWK